MTGDFDENKMHNEQNNDNQMAKQGNNKTNKQQNHPKTQPTKTGSGTGFTVDWQTLERVEADHMVVT